MSFFYIPNKVLNFQNITNDKIKNIINEINNYPRKVLNFNSTDELFHAFYS